MTRSLKQDVPCSVRSQIFIAPRTLNIFFAPSGAKYIALLTELDILLVTEFYKHFGAYGARKTLLIHHVTEK